MNIPNVALTTGCWLNGYQNSAECLDRNKLNTQCNLDFVNWQLYLTGKYSVSCLPMGHKYPVGSWHQLQQHREGQSSETQTTAILLLAQPEA